MNEPEVLSWPVIQQPFDDLMTAVSNLLEREPLPKLDAVSGARVVLLAQFRAANNTYRALRYLTAQVPEDPARKPEYALVGPILVRAISDGLFNVVFLLQSLAENISWFEKSAWREIYEENLRFRNSYGSDAEWADWLSGKEKLIEEMRVGYGVTATEVDKPSTIRYWPIPGQMLKSNRLSDECRSFLKYANDWIYRLYSSHAHLSGRGFMLHSAPLLDTDFHGRGETLDKRRSDSFFTALTLMLSMASELDGNLSLGVAERARFLWSVLTSYWPEADELFSRRYDRLLA